METSLSDARHALKEIIAKLEEVVPKATMQEPIILHAVTPHMQVFETSFGREVYWLPQDNPPELRVYMFSCGLRVYTLYIIGLWCAS